MGYQICSAAATRLAFPSSLSSGEVFFVKSGPHNRVVDGGEFDPSTAHFRHDSPPNEEAVRMCRLKGAHNDRHQSGGQCERPRSLLWNKHVVRFEGSAKVGSR